MEENSEAAKNEATLIHLLESSWQNIQHHSSARLAFLLFFLLFAGAATLIIALHPGNLLPALPVSIFVLISGLLYVRVAVRYKERIIRDMRVIYRIHELLLGNDEVLHGLLTTFKEYRKGSKQKQIAPRLSTTRHQIMVVEVFSSAMVGWALLPVFSIGWYGVAAVFGILLLLHEAFLVVMQRGMSFNI